MNVMKLVIAKFISKEKVVIELILTYWLINVWVYFFHLMNCRREGEEMLMGESENSRRIGKIR